jgi:signal transduction histidine kinase
MTELTVADLRPVDLFDDLSDEELAEWIAVAVPHTAEPGELLVEQGREPTAVMLLLEGSAQTMLVDGARTEPVGRQRAPTWSGAIAVVTQAAIGVRMVAETRCRIAWVPGDDFRRLAREQASVHQRVMRQVAPVMTRVAQVEQNRERLASLGTMAAGLAHELNNPAAAAQRAASQLAEAIEIVGSTIGHFVESGVERSDAETLVALQREALAGAAAGAALDTLDAADAEDALADRLAELGVAESWRLAEPLAAAGVDEAWLERVAAAAGPATDAAIQWVAAVLAAQGLAAELQESTHRMSDLVKAVKQYTYMDRGELVEADLHDGLDTTLKVLGHKLKHTSIQVVREYDRSLPRLTVHGSELNQVWTNLLDNAIDALGDHGTITITTCCKDSCAKVDISDDGPGIAPENHDRVFDQFFTTKDVGAGTGLGLATARRIVVDRHDGSLTFESEPGQTTFHVSLPLRQEKA